MCTAEYVRKRSEETCPLHSQTVSELMLRNGNNHSVYGPCRSVCYTCLKGQHLLLVAWRRFSQLPAPVLMVRKVFFRRARSANFYTSPKSTCSPSLFFGQLSREGPEVASISPSLVSLRRCPCCVRRLHRVTIPHHRSYLIVDFSVCA